MSEITLGMERQQMDAPDSEYVFAGRVMGTKWEFSDGTVQEAREMNIREETEQGHTFTYPVLLFDQGREFRASSFRKKMNPERDDAVKPAEVVSDRIFRWIRE